MPECGQRGQAARAEVGKHCAGAQGGPCGLNRTGPSTLTLRAYARACTKIVPAEGLQAQQHGCECREGASSRARHVRAPCEHLVDVDGHCGRPQHAWLQADVDAVMAQALCAPLEDSQAGRVGLCHLRAAFLSSQLRCTGARVPCRGASSNPQPALGADPGASSRV